MSQILLKAASGGTDICSVTMDHRPLNGAVGDDQASVLLAAVEQQLTRYFASISRQVEAIKVTNAEALAHQQAVNNEYQEALRAALEDRLSAFADYQHQRLSAIETQMASATAPAQPAAEPAVSHEALTNLTQQFTSKIDATERQLVDRLLQLEARVKEEQGTRIAQIESSVGRIGAGFDESVGAMSQRVLALDTALHGLSLRVDEIAQHAGQGGSADLDELRTQAAAAAGDAAGARADVARIAAAITQQFDQLSSRLAQLESHTGGTIDAEAAIHVERLDELERQVLRLSSGMVPGAAAASPTIVSAPADLGLGSVLGEAIASTTPIFAAPAATPAIAEQPVTPVAAANEPTPPIQPHPEPAAAAVAAPTPSTPSFMLDPDVWGSDSPEPAAPTGQVPAFSIDRAPSTLPAAAPTAAPMPLTRTVTAPPPMTLVPKLPSSRTVDAGARLDDELARHLAQQP